MFVPQTARMLYPSAGACQLIHGCPLKNHKIPATEKKRQGTGTSLGNYQPPHSAPAAVAVGVENLAQVAPSWHWPHWQNHPAPQPQARCTNSAKEINNVNNADIGITTFKKYLQHFAKLQLGILLLHVPIIPVSPTVPVVVPIMLATVVSILLIIGLLKFHILGVRKAAT